MTADGKHSNSEEVHIVVSRSLEFANAAARLASSGYVKDDEGKYALDLDTGAVYRLSDYSGPTWAAVGLLCILNMTDHPGTFGSGDKLLVNVDGVLYQIDFDDLPSGGAGGLYSSYAKISDTKANGTGGGTFTSGAWQTRDLNTEDSDPDGIVSIASNQFTLQAGSYRILVHAPAYRVNQHSAKLKNITDNADVIVGQNAYSAAGDYAVTQSVVSGRFVIASQKTFEIQHRCTSTQATNGFGGADSYGIPEIYTVVEIWKEL